MNKIPNALKNQCLADLKKPFNIVVTGAISPEQAAQIGLKAMVGLRNIYSGSLLGEDILAIEQHEVIDSIELDGEMGIL